MRRVLLAGLAAALLWGPAAAQTKVVREFTAIATELDRGRCDAARARKLVERDDFSELNSMARSISWAIIGLCDSRSLHEAALKATAEPQTPALAWSVRFMDAVQREDLADAEISLTAAAERRADQTLILDDLHVFRIGNKLRDRDPGGFRRYAAVLDQMSWRPKVPHYGADWLWAAYAAILVEEGDAANARRVAARVVEPKELLMMRLDKRFKAMVDAEPSRFDVVAASEASLQRHRDLIAGNPRDGAAISGAVAMLRVLGRQQEALELLDRALALKGDIKDAYGDDHRNWLINDRALVLLELGRFDEAVSAMQSAAGLREAGSSVNVSQTINLSGLQNATGRFDAALTSLRPFDADSKDVSPYGLMWIAAERVCALSGLGRMSEASAPLAHTAEHGRENLTARSKALLCANDLDGLADAFRTRLSDPQKQAEALMELSRFKSPAQRTAFDVELGRRMEAIRQRPDIRAAIDAVGRTEDLPIQSGPMIDAY